MDMINFLNCSEVFVMNRHTKAVERKKVTNKHLPLVVKGQIVDLSSVGKLDIHVEGITYTVTADNHIGYSTDVIISTSEKALQEALENV